MKRYLCPLSVFGVFCSAGLALADGLDLTVTNVRNDQGHVIVLVFDDARAFESLSYRHAADYAEIPAQIGSVSHRFDELTAGPYAIFLFHDEDGDQDIAYEADRLLEGAGASGAPNPEDIPDFAKASVMPGSVNVVLHYDE